MLLEEKLSEEIKDNYIFLCSYGLANFYDVKTHRLVKMIVRFHPYVILDELTYAVYTSPSNPQINNIWLPAGGDGK
jgi:hypothetical protein